MIVRRIRIERPGLQTIVVDAGRYGLRDRGVAWCGPMDARAYAHANELLGNDPRTAALECVLGDLAIVFQAPARCAIAGADTQALLDDRELPPWSCFAASAGSMLRLRRPTSGMRTIVAFDGGVDVPIVLGSRATDLMARFGGHEGRALRAGDVLALGAAHDGGAHVIAVPPMRAKIRVLLEPGYEALCERPWTIGHESNRMAWRLRGTPIAAPRDGIASRAVFPGTLQLPPSGEPIVLAADAQTTGGYPIAGMVLADDLSLLAQAPLGSSVQFTGGCRSI